MCACVPDVVKGFFFAAHVVVYQTVTAYLFRNERGGGGRELPQCPDAYNVLGSGSSDTSVSFSSERRTPGFSIFYPHSV